MRKARNDIESSFLHVMIQGDEKKYVFQNAKCKEKIIYLIKHNAFRNDVELIAYCIMDNHVHMLLFCPYIERISTMLKECNTSYGLFYNKRRNKIGHVFRERFRSEGIYTRAHLINCIKYIHENPVKARICRSVSQYPFSSYREFGKMNDIVRDICELSHEDIDEILDNPHTITQYMEDEYSKEEIKDAFNEVMKDRKIMWKDMGEITKVYLELKEKCRINDQDIAEMLGMTRFCLYRILKKNGMK